MRTRTFLLAALLAQGLAAQQPATPAPQTKPAEPCALKVPNTISLDEVLKPTMECDCRITAFKGTLYSRWGQQVFATEDPAQFPAGLLTVEKLQPGSYMWVVEYTAIHLPEPVERKSTGYINVL
jgi:hypothetical protein